MKKNLRVIQINGFRGLLVTLFIICCLIAGFIAFPAFVTMNGWNYLAVKTGSFPAINFGEGVLLWAIITFSIYIFNKKKFIVSFNAQQEMSDDEIKTIISRIKSQKISKNILIPKDFQKELNISKEHKEELETQTDKNEG